MMDIKDLKSKAFRFGIGGGIGVVTGLGIQFLMTSVFGVFYLVSALTGYSIGFLANFGSQILLGTVKIESVPSRPYSYQYPKNIISYFFQAQRHGLVRSILHHSKNLDIGCGLYKITKDSIGMDMKSWKNPDIVGSVFDIPFEDSNFDSVTLLEVIEHFDSEHQKKALKEIYRVLKPGGQLILSMPNISPFWGIPYRIIWKLWEHSVMSEYLHEHIGMIPRTELLKLLQDSGFRVESFHRVALLDVVADCRKTS